MVRKKKDKCTRCESLDRKQQSKTIMYTKDGIPMCTICMQEIAEEEEYFKRLEVEGEDEDDYGSCEEFN